MCCAFLKATSKARRECYQVINKVEYSIFFHFPKCDDLKNIGRNLGPIRNFIFKIRKSHCMCMF